MGLMILYFSVHDFNAKSVKSVLVQQLKYQTLKSPKTTREPVKFPKNNSCAGSACYRPEPRFQRDKEKLGSNTDGPTDDKAQPIDVLR